MIVEQYPYKIIQDIVNEFTLDCSYQFGFWPEIEENLKSAGQDPTLAAARYPFIMVSAGYTENKETNPSVYSEVDLDIYIVHHGEKGLSTPQRETQVYEAVLYPLYRELIERLELTPKLIRNNNGHLPHDKRNLYYLRVLDEKKLPISDYYDAIELKFQGLKIAKIYACTEI